MSRPASGPRIDALDERAFRDALRALPAGQGRLERGLQRSFRLGFRLVAWRLEVDLTAVSRDGPPGAGCIIATAPHRAWVEPFLLFVAWPATGARLVWLADGRTITRSWWRRRLLPRLGVLPISGRPGAVAGYAELAREVLERGMALVVFPEVGPPSPPDRTRRMSAGVAYLALGAGVPIVPVVVAGTHHIVRGSSFEVAALPPIEPGAPATDLRALATRDRARALAHRLQAAIETELRSRNERTDARRPGRDRWRWLGTLFS